MTTKKHTEPVVPVEEHRAADQDATVVEAFIAGTLPEEDRRTHVLVPLDALAEIRALIDGAKGETGYSATALLDQAAHALSALTT